LTARLAKYALETCSTTLIYSNPVASGPAAGGARVGEPLELRGAGGAPALATVHLRAGAATFPGQAARSAEAVRQCQGCCEWIADNTIHNTWCTVCQWAREKHVFNIVVVG